MARLHALYEIGECILEEPDTLKEIATFWRGNLCLSKSYKLSSQESSRKKYEDYAFAEVSLAPLLRHDNLARIVDAFCAETPRVFYAWSDRHQLLSMSVNLKRTINWGTRRLFLLFTGLFLGLNFLHERSLAHRLLAPQSIYVVFSENLSPTTLQISDFQSILYPNIVLRTPTPNIYSPPEMHMGGEGSTMQNICCEAFLEVTRCILTSASASELL